MSQSQPWPLSQSANKQSGVCSVCFATRQLHLKDGTVHQHGPRGSPCPGSNKPPVGISSAHPLMLSQAVRSAHQHAAYNQPVDPETTVCRPVDSQHDTVRTETVTTDPHSSTSFIPSHGSSISHPSYHGQIIKHIPRSARPHIASELTTVLNKITSNPDDPTCWSSLLEFGPTMLRAPPRSGRRHSLATMLLKRAMSSPPSDTNNYVHVNIQQRATKTTDDQCIATAVMSKIEDGNIRAAIRIITSDDRPADDSAETLQALRERHPCAAPDRQQFPDPIKFPTSQFTEEDVAAAIRSFPAGSSGGPDGVRPQHLRDLTTNKETGHLLVTSLTALINVLMQGKCPPTVTPIFFGGRLIALRKKSGGIRPIAIGYTWRRLAAKCVNKYAITVLGDSFTPVQLGVGISGGCEAAVHATRRFIAHMPDSHVLVKLDFSNAFNCVRRYATLSSNASTIPDIQLLLSCLPPNYNIEIRPTLHFFTRRRSAGRPYGPTTVLSGRTPTSFITCLQPHSWIYG